MEVRPAPLLVNDPETTYDDRSSKNIKFCFGNFFVEPEMKKKQQQNNPRRESNLPVFTSMSYPGCRDEKHLSDSLGSKLNACGLENRGLIPGTGRDHSLRHHVQTMSGLHPVSPTGQRGVPTYPISLTSISISKVLFSEMIQSVVR
jgi:hypothetical protein